MTAGVGETGGSAVRAVQALRSAPFCSKGVNDGRRALIKVERRFRRFFMLVRVALRLLDFPELKADPIQPVLAPPSGFVGGASRATGATTRRRGKNQGREKKKINPRSGVTMCDDTTKKQHSSRNPKGDGTRAERASSRGGMSSESGRPGDRTRHGGNVCWPT